MTNEEILNQAFEEIKGKIPVNHFKLDPEVHYVCDFIPPVVANYEVKGGKSCKVFRHNLYHTRDYRDSGCATFKLIKILQKASDIYNKVFWRVEPKVEMNMDFDSEYPIYRGLVRFSGY